MSDKIADIKSERFTTETTEYTITDKMLIGLFNRLGFQIPDDAQVFVTEIGRDGRTAINERTVIKMVLVKKT